jgi:tRNA-modifying protein YgfZ
MTDIMTSWLQFLVQHGAKVSEPPIPQVLDFGNDPALASPSSDFFAPLTDLGLIAATGEDAARFLHSQLTNDVEHLESSEARLAGYCSPKGRLIASFLMWKSAETVMLQIPCEIQAAVQKRLQMFVMRAKAKLTDVTPEHVILGIAGIKATAALTQWFPTLPATPYAKADSPAGTLIRVADATGTPRYQWICTQESAQQAWPILAQTLQPVGPQVWRLAEIQAGVPQITQATQEQFVPQMINFELIGGVSFKKGCYPGQEIVARSQYLGKLKRRMLRASSPTKDAKAGMEVFSSTDPDQPCGMIVNAEQASADQMECLVEIKVAAKEDGSIHLGSADGPALHFAAMPYALTDPA